MALIHSPDAFLASALTGGIDLDAGNLKCALIDITSYARATDVMISDLTQITGAGYTAGGQALTSVTVATDTTAHKTVITYNTADWTGSTTISATGAAVYDSVSGRVCVVDDFQSTVSSSGGLYHIDDIVAEYTGF